MLKLQTVNNKQLIEDEKINLIAVLPDVLFAMFMD